MITNKRGKSSEANDSKMGYIEIDETADLFKKNGMND